MADETSGVSLDPQIDEGIEIADGRMPGSTDREGLPGGIRMFENDRASAALGMKIVEISPGHAVLTMRVREDMLNGFRMAHGGIVFALADTAFAAACNEDNRVTVSAGAEISYLKPSLLGQLLTATAHRRHLSGRNGIYDVQVRNETEVVAEFRGRSRITSLSPPEAKE